MTMMRTDYEEALLRVSDALRRHNKPAGGISSREACELILEAVAYECGQKSVEERPTGHWIKEKDCCLLIYRCSNCKKFIWSRETESDEKFEDLSRLDSYRYCPRCGADKRPEEE